MSSITSNEDATSSAHFQDLMTPAGTTGSGVVRYAAAMYFYQRRMLGSKALEIYRALAKDNLTDPMPLLKAAGCLQETESRDLIARVEHGCAPKAQAISVLVSLIDRYLASFVLHGVKDVRDGIARWTGSAVQPMKPETLSACSHLSRALTVMKDRELAEAIYAALPQLKWISYDAYPRADIGEAFADGHAFASLIGEGSFFHASDFDLGLFVIGPDVLYPDHFHAAPELYAPLTGPHAWRFLPGQDFQWFDPDVPIWNEPWAPHATLTGTVPFLSIYCWTRDVHLPAKVIPVTAGEATP